eukprot:scaffold59452_cov26-Tisochrysis_lutea.AAC.4
MPSPRMPSLERANAISSPPPAVAARASMCASVSLELRLLPSPWMPSLERPSTSSSPPPAVAVRASMCVCACHNCPTKPQQHTPSERNDMVTMEYMAVPMSSMRE